MTYDNTNKGVLFSNDKNGNDKAPDRKGKLNVAGVDYEIAGWIKTGKSGQPFLSLSVQPKRERAEEQAPTTDNDLNDEIPF